MPSLDLRQAAVMAAALAGLGACGGEGPSAPRDEGNATDPVDAVADLVAEGAPSRRVFAGRRSDDPFRVRVLDRSGHPLSEVRVRFALEGTLGGVLSQEVAVSDEAGLAETYLLDARPGTGQVVARVGTVSAGFEVMVDRAPGRIVFLTGPGGDETAGAAVTEPALPGLQPPDSIVRVQVLDTEDQPLAGVEVWFAWIGLVSEPRDTTDAQGIASTVLRASPNRSGPASLVAFILDFLDVTAFQQRMVGRVADRVVLVSVNGLRADALERYELPTFDRLRGEGSWFSGARTVLPTLTLPAHLSLLGGVGPEGHGIFSEELTFTPEMARLDPLFRRASREGHRAVAYMSGEGPLSGFDEILACKLAFGLDSLTLVPPLGASVVDEALPALQDPAQGLIFLHIPDPDLAGHAHGFESPEYEQAVRSADQALERILAAAAGDSTLVVVTSDHGGGGAFGPRQHGSSSPADVEIPILLWGSGPHPRQFATASILDLAPTILWALGIPPPNQYEGRILFEAFR